jgi:hypothetical protein
MRTLKTNSRQTSLFEQFDTIQKRVKNPNQIRKIPKFNLSKQLEKITLRTKINDTDILSIKKQNTNNYTIDKSLFLNFIENIDSFSDSIIMDFKESGLRVIEIDPSYAFLSSIFLGKEDFIEFFPTFELQVKINLKKLRAIIANSYKEESRISFLFNSNKMLFYSHHRLIDDLVISNVNQMKETMPINLDNQYSSEIIINSKLLKDIITSINKIDVNVQIEINEGVFIIKPENTKENDPFNLSKQLSNGIFIEKYTKPLQSIYKCSWISKICNSSDKFSNSLKISIDQGKPCKISCNFLKNSNINYFISPTLK